MLSSGNAYVTHFVFEDLFSTGVDAISEIPALYETDGVPFEKKTIYEKWSIDRIGFYWLIAELDKKENLAFGYANLNDEQMAEWGHISISELIDCGASKDRDWKPASFPDAQKIIKQYKEGFDSR